MNKLINLIEFTTIGDERGNLISLEEEKNIPFKIKRIYYLFDNHSGVVRGHHAHKKLQQVLVCLSGSCRIKLDDGKNSEFIILNDKKTGLWINSLIWREMDQFSSSCVLLVLASDFYNEEDYIRNYKDFLSTALKL